jgi:hypothetical protein
MIMSNAVGEQCSHNTARYGIEMAASTTTVSRGDPGCGCPLRNENLVNNRNKQDTGKKL